MKQKTKLNVLLLTIFLIIISLSGLVIGSFYKTTQKNSLTIFKNEFLSESAQLIEESAELFFKSIDLKILEGKSTDAIIDFIKESDRLNRWIMVFDFNGQSLLNNRSREWEEFESLISPDIINREVETGGTKNKIRFSLDNFNQFINKESNIAISPKKVIFQIYRSQDIIIGYGRLIKSLKPGVSSLEQKNQGNGRRFLLIAFPIVIIGMALIIFAAFIFSRKPFFDIQPEIGPDELESQVKQRTKELSETVEQLKREIQEQKQIEAEYLEARTEAESSNRAKSQFLANMSHEIRTPMNAIIGMSELVLDTELSIEQEEFITTLKTSAESLLGLLNDILDLSKIELGKLDIEPIEFHFRGCLNEITKNLFIHVQRKNIELIYDIALDIPNILLCDANRLRQILTNLIGNAVKFTEQGIILLKVVIEERKPVLQDTQEELVLHFSISDTGIGIPVDKQKLIFEKFTQSDSSITRRFGGSGLGLAISMQLVQLMGGTLWVQSPGELKYMKAGAPGSTFHFTLPFIVPRHEIREIGETVDIKMLKGIPVLVVDDNPINRKIFKEILGRWGLKPHLVENGFQAMKILTETAQKNNAFKLVLMDIQMPEMDGFETVKRIREDETIKDTLIIVLTSAGVKGDGQRCRDLGISAYLRKPVPFNELLETLLIVMANLTPKKKDIKLITWYSLRESRKKTNILVVEDNLINQKLIVRLLEKRGYLVDIANNGKEAVEKMSLNNYDLALMDIQMPEMDGIEATKLIRKRENEECSRRVPIVALTAHAMKGDKERFLKAGMNSYISKPIKQDELMETIEKLVYENYGEE